METPLGTWDAGSFGNDTALDFSAWLHSADQIALTIAAPGSTQIDADKACDIIVACEFVAAMMGRPAQDIPEDALSRIGRLKFPGDDLTVNARRMVERISAISELAELWAEDDDQEWKDAIQDLLDRLDPAKGYHSPRRADQPTAQIYAHCFVCEGSISEEDAVDLVHEIDDGIIFSTMTLHAHRDCVEQKFEPPHWNDDGTPSDAVKYQFSEHIGVALED